MKFFPRHGFLIVDKPPGLTSRDAVNRVQSWFPRSTRLGHTGTLDPLATGVLVLAVGSGTRLTEYVQDMEKVYRAGIRLGGRSDTDDADGTIAPATVSEPPERTAVEAALQTFIGEIGQVPPTYSAAKVTGRRAYDLARRGQELTLPPRRVQIYEILILSYEYPNLDLEVRCGKGTYIRSLARDLGERFGCGGYIVSLRRMRVGPFRVEDGIALTADRDTAQSRLLPLETAVRNLPRVELDAAAACRFRAGAGVPLPVMQDVPYRQAAVFDGTTRMLLGIGEVNSEEGRLLPLKVITQKE